MGILLLLMRGTMPDRSCGVCNSPGIRTRSGSYSGSPKAYTILSSGDEAGEYYLHPVISIWLHSLCIASWLDTNPTKALMAGEYQRD